MNWKIGAVLALVATVSRGSAADSMEAYFAYAYSPIGRAGQYTYLAHQPCADKAASKLGWSRAAFSTAGGDLLRACWQDVSSDKIGSAVRVCMVSSADKLGNACRYISKRYFLDAATLPRRPKF